MSTSLLKVSFQTDSSDNTIAEGYICSVGKTVPSRSKTTSPNLSLPQAPANNNGTLFLGSLNDALPHASLARNGSEQRPNINTGPSQSFAAPPPRNASLHSPLSERHGNRPFASDIYHNPSPPLPGHMPDQSQYLPIEPHRHGSAPPPRSAPILPQYGLGLPGMPQPSRSHDGHTRINPDAGQYHQQISGSAYMQKLRHAQSTDGLRPGRPMPHHLDIPSPIERGGYDEAEDDSPISPVDPNPTRDAGPAVISAQMKCKVFLKQSHQQWKALGGARLKLYVQTSTNIKQLVVESDSKDKTMLISTIVLTDGVERVAKTGVAVEISDVNGSRTGIIYMIQLRNEDSAGGLFDSLIAGSDRAVNNSVHRRGK